MAAEFLERMGDRLRERRDEMDLSRAEVARRMSGKVNENQVYRWEKGLHQPNPDTLEELARVLERDVAYFMAAAPDTVAVPELVDTLGHETSLGRIEQKLDAILAALTPTTKRQADQLARALAEAGRAATREREGSAREKPVRGRRKRAEGADDG